MGCGRTPLRILDALFRILSALFRMLSAFFAHYFVLKSEHFEKYFTILRSFFMTSLNNNLEIYYE